ncbi:hypothetical protein GIB67_010494 [Kingdonia uniflora]|uniref:Phospholipid/glycerol acyltransferase domain-containing protein n=1 Tax=Kingdonia uniflora TaxID=39325 RepID=A0A7J7MAX3_9MAGN|nr:hypothetical protein GIB67_010494 [Kingdonia uniflora]
MKILQCSMPCTSLFQTSLKSKVSQANYGLRFLVNVAPRNNFNFSRKSDGLSCEGCNLKTAFSRSCYQISIWKKSPVRRNSVVRSNLAGAKFPDTTYSLKEFQLGSRVRGICFYTVTSFVAIFLFLLMLAVHPFVILFDRYRRKAHHLIGKIWAKLTVFLFFKVELEGLENLPAPDVPAVYISNHQSFLDIFTLLILGRNFKFISKTTIFLFPVIGWAMYLMGTIRLKRMDSRSQFDCFKRCMNLLGKGASVFFFPEGTRSKDGKLGVFKKASLAPLNCGGLKPSEKALVKIFWDLAPYPIAWGVLRKEFDGKAKMTEAVILNMLEMYAQAIVRIAKIEAGVVTEDLMRFDGVGLKMNHYKETTERESYCAIDVVGGEDEDVLKSFRSKSHDIVVTLIREVHPIDDSDHHEVQPKKTNTTPKPIPRVEQVKQIEEPECTKALIKPGTTPVTANPTIPTAYTATTEVNPIESKVRRTVAWKWGEDSDSSYSALVFDVQKGAFSVAAKTGVPVVPITLIGTGKLMPPGMETRLNSGWVKVVIHKPIQGNNADVLCDNAKNAIANALLSG